MFVSGAALHGNAFLTAGEGLVCLHDAAGTVATHRCCEAASPHRFADTMANEPARLERDLERAVELVCADAFFAAGHEMKGLQPPVHGDVAGLEDRADLHVELFPAHVALVIADARALALHLGDALGALAVGADRTVRPDLSLNPIVGCLFVLKMRNREK